MGAATHNHNDACTESLFTSGLTCKNQAEYIKARTAHRAGNGTLSMIQAEPFNQMEHSN